MRVRIVAMRVCAIWLPCNVFILRQQMQHLQWSYESQRNYLAFTMIHDCNAMHCYLASDWNKQDMEEYLFDRSLKEPANPATATEVIQLLTRVAAEPYFTNYLQTTLSTFIYCNSAQLWRCLEHVFGLKPHPMSSSPVSWCGKHRTNRLAQEWPICWCAASWKTISRREIDGYKLEFSCFFWDELVNF